MEIKSLQKDRVFGLDFLRTIAISLVVISHGTYILCPNSESALLTFTRVFGAIGVDLFFVLSGFLIGGILIKIIQNPTSQFSDLILFWKRRWLRTIPNYVLILIVNVLLCVSLGKVLPDSIFNYVVFTQNFTSPHPDFFTEAWSLSIEEYAYLLVPLLLFLSVKLFGTINKIKLFIRLTIAVVTILLVFKLNYFLTAEVDSYKTWSATFRKVVLYRLDSIYIGFVAVYVTNYYEKLVLSYKGALAVIGVVLLFSLHAVIYFFHLLPQTNLWFYVFVYLNVVICSLALLLPYFSKYHYSGFGKSIVVFISKTSYSIYLVNYSIVLLTIEHFYVFSDLSFLSRIGFLILFLGLTVVLSTIIYKFFELPILRYRNRKYPS